MSKNSFSHLNSFFWYKITKGYLPCLKDDKNNLVCKYRL